MSNEYKLSYTANEIDNKLGKIDKIEQDVKASVADYNQNDETAPDYIKNRPFYTSDPVETVFVKNNSLVIEEDLYTELSYENDVSLQIGNKYTVLFNGVRYECVAKYGKVWETIYLGNGNFVGESNDDTEPFAIDSYDDGSIFLNVLEEGTYSIEITGVFAKINTIDEKYLSKSIPIVHSHRDCFMFTYSLNKIFSCSGLGTVSVFSSGNNEVTVSVPNEQWDEFYSFLSSVVNFNTVIVYNGRTVEVECESNRVTLFDKYIYNDGIAISVSTTYLDYDTESETVTVTYEDNYISLVN